MDQKIVVFQLITGEIGVGKLDEKIGIIRKVVKPIQTPQRGNSQGVIRISLIPFLVPFSNHFPDIALDKTISYAPAIPELANQYIETTTGIKMATPEDIKKVGIN